MKFIEPYLSSGKSKNGGARKSDYLALAERGIISANDKLLKLELIQVYKNRYFYSQSNL
jgi:hypothetical protein